MPANQEHHYVPASYFNPWCDANGQMTYFKWFRQKFVVGSTSPKSATKERLLYALHGAPEHLLVAMETKFFTPIIDEPGASIRRILLEQGPDALSEDQRHIWTRYVMALHARRPEAIKHARDVGRQVILDTLRNDAEYAELRTENMPESLEDLVAPWALENFGMMVAPGFIDHEPTHETVMTMHWWCLDLRSSAHDLLTGDRPLIWPLGANDPKFYFAVPLSPRVCFFATKQVEMERLIMEAPASVTARRVNESVIGQSAGYVYAAHDRHAVGGVWELDEYLKENLAEKRHG